MSCQHALEHTLVVFNAVDVPDDIQWQVMALLRPYDPDTYTRAADASGHTHDHCPG